jgi:hypothetical protein
MTLLSTLAGLVGLIGIGLIGITGIGLIAAYRLRQANPDAEHPTESTTERTEQS